MRTKSIIIFITVCVFLCVLFIIAAGWFLYSRIGTMYNLPAGDIITSSDSPDGSYRVSAYLCNGGATVDYAVRGEVTSLSTGEHRNIYWEYHCETADIMWIDDNTVKINGRQLDVRTESYDFRQK